ncbi:hypothetical protein A3K24_01585 [candidate division Kazan bacterium RIFCSPHIGHO2_01_FULL_44_14]|uniref:LTD domain-containing protein n=1 Tax=candidate division Kazan bacterium RIFCSPLOWO2_01_FULL_45_19 TaxID=1798538 RepID=A0A1F4NQH3_UNCK3|nr:hypothetical protein [uncultured bacterium]OGB73528.1 MAG: hypothetical protein A3K51_01585 [candidate division Kazan bacterium RIFCSPLOWO2_01_FULL_45_19]OGB77773.1 MAG: hypothetical protein A3K24_01585 [candidate division Kazan bacterium RIFCSPHIGHO2_01_FULL_44_14]
MWGKVLCWIIVTGLGLGLVQFVSAEGESPSVIINEVAWAGSTKSNDDEWIELKNTTDAPVNISDWKITRANSITDGNTIATFGEGVTIPSGGFLLISHFSQDDQDNSVLNAESVVVEDKMLLADSNLRLRLWQPGIETRIDELTNITQSGYDKENKITTERTSDVTGWQSSTRANHPNFDIGVTDLGTPSAENSTITEPPTLASITPNTVTQGEALEVENIVGTNFSTESLPTLQLVRGNLTINGTDINVVNSTLIDRAEFSTAGGTEVGMWNLTLTNPDGKIATLPNAVEVLAPEPEFDLGTTVRINEIYPHPNTTSNDEFIELYNSGDRAINLLSWRLDDIPEGGSAPYTFENVNIGAKGFLVIYKPQSKLTLNDNGDSVYLIQPDNFVLDQVDYDNAGIGQTLSRFTSGWKWTTTPTPNGANVLSEPVDDTQPNEPPLEPDDEPITPTYQSKDLELTELLPNPNSSDEFIELFNPGTSAINLTDWQLKDASGKKYTIGDFEVTVQANGLLIQPQQYVVITQTMSKIALNNSGGETVTLLDPSGQIVDSASYPDKAPVGASYALITAGLWTWVPTPTPGQANLVTLSEDMPTPTIEVVSTLPDTLPVTGGSARRWLGVLLVSFALAGVVFWERRKKLLH